MDKLWYLIELIVRGTMKKASNVVRVNGRDFEATIYVVPMGDSRPVYRIDLSEVVEKT